MPIANKFELLKENSTFIPVIIYTMYDHHLFKHLYKVIDAHFDNRSFFYDICEIEAW